LGFTLCNMNRPFLRLNDGYGALIQASISAVIVFICRIS